MRKWLLLALVVVVIDQFSKLWIDGNLFYGQTIPVIPSFNIVKAYNPGAAFSFLADAGGWQRHFFSVIAVVVSIGLVWMLRKNSTNRLLSSALSLILGGAIGNLIDRIAYGHVVDFIQIYYQQWYYPAFNLADSAICVGAALMIIDSFKKQPDVAH
ncbi:signal peptidase II [Chitinivorax tropicus]|uniref:Lipoprotein signal peptidase n=1 Tax=Chitinivorax tropicus TaxID=714531 RepID=A0A840MK46_9PROT|nr:signal peptidase II [Chitinivorax tropicus]MBB5016936.1 signal peptidase II [Chitinivorax tropicus]